MVRKRMGMVLLVWAGAWGAVAEPAAFPERVTLRDGGREVELGLTGTAERNFLVVKVYRMAHYMEGGQAGGAGPAVERVFSGAGARHIRMVFLRDLPREKIKAELRKSMLRNAREDWIAGSGKAMDDFLEAIDRDARRDDVLALSWFSGGRVLAEFNGEAALEIENENFARMLWSIWFGEKPVVRREDLLSALQNG